LCNHPRNMTGDMIKLLAKNGGIIDINFVDEYLKTPKPNKEKDSLITNLKSKFDEPNLSDDKKAILYKEWDIIQNKFSDDMATLSDVVDHIDYVVKLVGIDHVGIGSDFDGGGKVKDIKDVSEISNITTELLKRGYSENDIKKIWSGNFMRVFKEVENIANK